jgi:beta-galactosidase
VQIDCGFEWGRTVFWPGAPGKFMGAKKITAAILAGLALLPTSLWAAPSLIPAGAGTVMPLDAGWRFLKADPAGAEPVKFADGDWRPLDLPHDWSIEGPFAATNKTGGAGGFLPSGIGWYRKHFMLPENDSNRVVRVEFDGVMANSDVWINGFHLGHRPNGYVSFSYELTGHLNLGGDNVLAVRADTSAQPASRWYSGAGIYRHVRLRVTDRVHLAENGVFVSTPKVSAAEATVRVEITLTNETDRPREISVQTTLLAPNGQTVTVMELSATVGAGAAEKLQPQMVLSPPQLWNLESPARYRAVIQVRADGKLLDEQTVAFGIRDAHFEAATGFWLNGKNFKIKGVCLHADGGAFGAAVPLTVWEARLKTLKSLGVNAIRTAHNPPAPEFLDLCDRLGLLVMDEFFDCWTVAKNPYDYHLYFNDWSQRDERDAILRDRNHPCVILYSVGNEIHDTPQAEKAKRILKGLVAVAHEADPTRPMTQALFRPNVSHDYDDGLADLLDVVGQNYRESEILAAHAQNPARKILGTENTHDRKQWVALRDHPAYAGQFLWTGIDYLGESRRWPVIGHGSGLLDRTGAIRPLARERESWWSDKPMVAITRRISRTEDMPEDPGYGAEERHTQVLFSDWTPKNLAPHAEQVEIYSNGQEVELFLNGQSLGVKPLNADASPRGWSVPFAPGTLKAVARNGGQTVATDELTTAGQPAKIILTTETTILSPGFDSVAMVRAKITDADGREIPRAGDLISFNVSGPGVIAAVDNGDSASHESFQGTQRHAFQGECVVFVKATAAAGQIQVRATAAGLEAGAVSLTAVSEPTK